MTEAAQHDRAVAAMANELRQLVDTANAPIFGIDVNVSQLQFFEFDVYFCRHELLSVPRFLSQQQSKLQPQIGKRPRCSTSLRFLCTF